MARTSYAPIYSDITDRLLNERTRPHHAVLQALANRCDQHGLTIVGVRYLSDKAGYVEPTVQRVIEDFIAWGWVRSHQVADALGRSRHYFQLSPDVLYIREELESDAWSMWHNDSVTRNVSPATETNVSHPSGFQNQGPDSGVQTHEPESPYPEKQQTSSSPSRATENAKFTESPAAPQPQKTAGTARNAALPCSADQKAPPSSAPPPPQIAQEIARVTGTCVWQAQRLVERYPDTIETAFKAVKIDMQAGSVRNPAGLLTYFLESGCIEPGAGKRTNDGSEYLNDKYAAYFVGGGQ